MINKIAHYLDLINNENHKKRNKEFLIKTLDRGLQKQELIIAIDLYISDCIGRERLNRDDMEIRLFMFIDSLMNNDISMLKYRNVLKFYPEREKIKSLLRENEININHPSMDEHLIFNFQMINLLSKEGFGYNYNSNKKYNLKEEMMFDFFKDILMKVSKYEMHNFLLFDMSRFKFFKHMEKTDVRFKENIISVFEQMLSSEKELFLNGFTKQILMLDKVKEISNIKYNFAGLMFIKLTDNLDLYSKNYKYNKDYLNDFLDIFIDRLDCLKSENKDLFYHINTFVRSDKNNMNQEEMDAFYGKFLDNDDRLNFIFNHVDENLIKFLLSSLYIDCNDMSEVNVLNRYLLRRLDMADLIDKMEGTTYNMEVFIGCYNKNAEFRNHISYKNIDQEKIKNKIKDFISREDQKIENNKDNNVKLRLNILKTKKVDTLKLFLHHLDLYEKKKKYLL